jgi:hypothetical protein
VPLLAVGLAWKGGVRGVGRRFLLAFMPIFFVGNLVIFQAWDWDNTKVFLYWFLATCIVVAGLLVELWRDHRPRLDASHMAALRGAAVQGLVAGGVLVLVLPGLLLNVHQLVGRDRHLLLTSEEVQVAAAVRAQTPADSVFAVGLQHNHPVPVLAGRQVVMSFPGWLWSQGFDYTARERELRTIFELGSEAAPLLTKYHVDYVVIGPYERTQLTGNLTGYRDAYPRIIQTPNYEVFAVGGRS